MRAEPYAITFLLGDGIFVDRATEDQPGPLQSQLPAFTLTMERQILDGTQFDMAVRSNRILLHHALRFFRVAANGADGQKPRG